jgi:hypothetical protein
MITGASIFTNKDILKRVDGTEIEMTTRIYSFDTDDPILPLREPIKTTVRRHSKEIPQVLGICVVKNYSKMPHELEVDIYPGCNINNFS